MNPFAWMKRPKKITLVFYMKSGNRIVTDVTEYSIKNRGDEIVGVQLVPYDKNAGILVQTLALSQIECVSVL